MRTYPLYVLVLQIYSFSQRLEFSQESLFRVSKFRFDFHSQVFDLAIFFFNRPKGEMKDLRIQVPIR